MTSPELAGVWYWYWRGWGCVSTRSEGDPARSALYREIYFDIRAASAPELSAHIYPIAKFSFQFEILYFSEFSESEECSSMRMEITTLSLNIVTQLSGKGFVV